MSGVCTSSTGMFYKVPARLVVSLSILPLLWQHQGPLACESARAAPIPISSQCAPLLYSALALLTARDSYKDTEYSAVEIICFYVSPVDNHKTKPNYSSPHKSCSPQRSSAITLAGFASVRLDSQGAKRGRTSRNSAKSLSTIGRKGCFGSAPGLSSRKPFFSGGHPTLRTQPWVCGSPNPCHELPATGTEG